MAKFTTLMQGSDFFKAFYHWKHQKFVSFSQLDLNVERELKSRLGKKKKKSSTTWVTRSAQRTNIGGHSNLFDIGWCPTQAKAEWHPVVKVKPKEIRTGNKKMNHRASWFLKRVKKSSSILYLSENPPIIQLEFTGISERITKWNPSMRNIYGWDVHSNSSSGLSVIRTVKRKVGNEKGCLILLKDWHQFVQRDFTCTLYFYCFLDASSK